MSQQFSNNNNDSTCSSFCCSCSSCCFPKQQQQPLSEKEQKEQREREEKVILLRKFRDEHSGEADGGGGGGGKQNRDDSSVSLPRSCFTRFLSVGAQVKAMKRKRPLVAPTVSAALKSHVTQAELRKQHEEDVMINQQLNNPSSSLRKKFSFVDGAGGGGGGEANNNRSLALGAQDLNASRMFSSRTHTDDSAFVNHHHHHHNQRRRGSSLGRRQSFRAGQDGEGEDNQQGENNNNLRHSFRQRRRGSSLSSSVKGFFHSHDEQEEKERREKEGDNNNIRGEQEEGENYNNNNQQQQRRQEQEGEEEFFNQQDDVSSDEDSDDDGASDASSEDDFEVKAQVDAEELVEKYLGPDNLKIFASSLAAISSTATQQQRQGEGGEEEEEEDENNNNNGKKKKKKNKNKRDESKYLSGSDASWWELLIRPPRHAPALQYNSLFLLPAHFSLRDVLYNLIKTRAFEYTILVFIVLNCVFLGIEDQKVFDDRSDEIYFLFDNIFVGVFSFEMVVKILAFGFVWHRGSYLRDSWNCLDFLIMLLTYLNYVQGSGNFTALRSLRVLRPLRSLNAIPGLKILVRSFLASLRAMGAIALLSLLVIYVFAIIGVQLFSGLFRFSCVNDYDYNASSLLSCRNGSTGEIDSGSYWGLGCPSNETCKDVGNPGFGYYSFDNVLTALLLVFSFSTFDGWTTALERSYGSVGVISFLFFALCVMVVGILIPNLLLAVINLEYSKEQQRDREQRASYNSRLKQLISLKLNALSIRLPSRCVLPEEEEEEEEETDDDDASSSSSTASGRKKRKKKKKKNGINDALSSSSPSIGSGSRDSETAVTQSSISNPLLFNGGKFGMNLPTPNIVNLSDKKEGGEEGGGGVENNNNNNNKFVINKSGGEQQQDIEMKQIYLPSATSAASSSSSSSSGENNNNKVVGQKQGEEKEEEQHEEGGILEILHVSGDYNPEDEDDDDGEDNHLVVEVDNINVENENNNNNNNNTSRIHVTSAVSREHSNNSENAMKSTVNKSSSGNLAASSSGTHHHHAAVVNDSFSSSSLKPEKSKSDRALMGKSVSELILFKNVNKGLSRRKSSVGLNHSATALAAGSASGDQSPLSPSLNSGGGGGDENNNNNGGGDSPRKRRRDRRRNRNNNGGSDPSSPAASTLSADGSSFSPPSSPTSRRKRGGGGGGTEGKKKDESVTAAISEWFSNVKSYFTLAPETWHEFDAWRDSCHELTEGFPRTSAQAAAIHVSKSNTSLINAFSTYTDSENSSFDYSDYDEDDFRHSSEGRNHMIEDEAGANVNDLAIIQKQKRPEENHTQAGSRVSGESSAQADTGQIRSTWFINFIVVMILLNTIVLASQHHNQPDWLSLSQAIANGIFTGIFAIEMIMRLFSIGFRAYVTSNFDLLDGFIVMSSIIELAVTGGGGTSTFSVFRALRLLRVMKLLKQFPSLRSVVRVALYAMGDALYLLVIVLLYIFIFSLLGTAVFKGKLPVPEDLDSDPHTSYDSFVLSFYASFQVMSMDLWVTPMYTIMKTTHPLAALFFVIQIITGGFILISLFLSILVAAFRKLESRVAQEEGALESSDQLRERQNAFKHNMLDQTLVQRVYRFGANTRGREFNKSDFQSAALGFSGALDAARAAKEEEEEMMLEEEEMIERNNNNNNSNEREDGSKERMVEGKSENESGGLNEERNKNNNNIIRTRRSGGGGGRNHPMLTKRSLSFGAGGLVVAQRRFSHSNNTQQQQRQHQQDNFLVNEYRRAKAAKDNEKRQLARELKRRDVNETNILFSVAGDELDNIPRWEDDSEYGGEGGGDNNLDGGAGGGEDPALHHNPFFDDVDVIDLEQLAIREEEHGPFEQAIDPASRFLHRHSTFKNFDNKNLNPNLLKLHQQEQEQQQQQQQNKKQKKNRNHQSHQRDHPDDFFDEDEEFERQQQLELQEQEDQAAAAAAALVNIEIEREDYEEEEEDEDDEDEQKLPTSFSKPSLAAMKIPRKNRKVNLERRASLSISNLESHLKTTQEIDEIEKREAQRHREKQQIRRKSTLCSKDMLKHAEILEQSVNVNVRRASSSRISDGQHQQQNQKRIMSNNPASSQQQLGHFTFTTAANNNNSNNNNNLNAATAAAASGGVSPLSPTAIAPNSPSSFSPRSQRRGGGGAGSPLSSPRGSNRRAKTPEVVTNAKNNPMLLEWQNKTSDAVPRYIKYLRTKQGRIEDLSPDQDPVRFLYRYQFNEYSRLKRANSANRFFATRPNRPPLAQAVVSLKNPTILAGHAPQEDDKPPAQKLPVCSACGQELIDPLPPAPLVAQPSPEVLHSLKCGRIRMRRAREKILFELLEILEFYIKTNEPQNEETVEMLLGKADEVDTLKNVSVEDLVNACTSSSSSSSSTSVSPSRSSTNSVVPSAAGEEHQELVQQHEEEGDDDRKQQESPAPRDQGNDSKKKKKKKKEITIWHALSNEIKEELQVLELRVGEDELGKSLIAQAFATIPVEHKTNGGDALYVFGPENKLRVFCSIIVSDAWFEAFILFCVIVSSALMAIANPLDDPESTKARVSFVGSFIFTIIFAVEAGMKIIAMGFYQTPAAYLKDPWNVLDFSIVLVSLVSDTQSDFNLSFLKVFRTLRATRALRVLRRARGMKTVVFALVQNIKAIANVALLCFIFLLIFAILAVQLFAGMFQHCTDPSIIESSNCTGYWFDPNAQPRNTSHLVLNAVSLNISASDIALQHEANAALWRAGAIVPRMFISDFQNFDDVARALLTLFEITSAEGWMYVVWRATDTCTEDPLSRRSLHCSPELGLFFVFFFAFSSFFLMQLFVSFIIYNYEKVNKTVSGNEFLTAEQRVWVATQNLVSNFRPSVVVFPATGYQYTKWLHKKILSNFFFDMSIALFILADVVILSLDHYGMTPAFASALDTASTSVAFAFLIEAILKLACYHLRYFHSPENRFDFFLVLIGILSWDKVGINLRFLVALRVIRLSRILRLLRFAKGIQILLETLVYSLPSMANMGAFIVLITFSFSVLGVDLFAKIYIPPNAYVFNDRFANFRQLDSALMLLFRFMTLEDWVGAMLDASVDHPTCNDLVDNGDSCGGVMAPLYFCLYVVAVSYIVLNLIMASMLVQFELTMALDESNPKMAILHRFVERWSEYDPDATMLMLTRNVPPMLAKLGPPMGLLRAGSRLQILRKMGTFFIPEHEGQVHFMEVLLALEMGLSPPQREEEADRVKREFFVMMTDNFPELEDLPTQRIGNGRMITADLHFAQTYLAAAERRRQTYRRTQDRLFFLARSKQLFSGERKSMLLESLDYFKEQNAILERKKTFYVQQLKELQQQQQQNEDDDKEEQAADLLLLEDNNNNNNNNKQNENKKKRRESVAFIENHEQNDDYDNEHIVILEDADGDENDHDDDYQDENIDLDYGNAFVEIDDEEENENQQQQQQEQDEEGEEHKKQKDDEKEKKRRKSFINIRRKSLHKLHRHHSVSTDEIALVLERASFNAASLAHSEAVYHKKRQEQQQKREDEEAAKNKKQQEENEKQEQPLRHEQHQQDQEHQEGQQPLTFSFNARPQIGSRCGTASSSRQGSRQASRQQQHQKRVSTAATDDSDSCKTASQSRLASAAGALSLGENEANQLARQQQQQQQQRHQKQQQQQQGWQNFQGEVIPVKIEHEVLPSSSASILAAAAAGAASAAGGGGAGVEGKSPITTLKSAVGAVRATQRLQSRSGRMNLLFRPTTTARTTASATLAALNRNQRRRDSDVEDEDDEEYQQQENNNNNQNSNNQASASSVLMDDVLSNVVGSVLESSRLAVSEIEDGNKKQQQQEEENEKNSSSSKNKRKKNREQDGEKKDDDDDDDDEEDSRPATGALFVRPKLIFAEAGCLNPSATSFKSSPTTSSPRKKKIRSSKKVYKEKSGDLQRDDESASSSSSSFSSPSRTLLQPKEDNSSSPLSPTSSSSSSPQQLSVSGLENNNNNQHQQNQDKRQEEDHDDEHDVLVEEDDPADEATSPRMILSPNSVSIITMRARKQNVPKQEEEEEEEEERQ